MPIPSGYQPLIDFLALVTEREIALSYEEIEVILDAALPPSASTQWRYWSGTGNYHVQALRAHGWRAHLDRRRGIIIFTRDTEEKEER